ncbi:MAG: CvpA family protein [Muribaculaceae bacterium]|nr:CvpA family protein [Muribaculaceae bacterium]
MTAIDIIIIVVFFGAVIYGYWKGVIVQLGSLAGILLGILACRLFGPWLTEVLGGATGSSDAIDMGYINGIIANVILFILGFLCAKLVARLVKTVTTAVKLSIVDKLLGVIFCLFEWFLVLSILLNVWQVLRPGVNVAASSTLGRGRAARAVMDLAPAVLGTQTALAIFDVKK